MLACRGRFSLVRNVQSKDGSKAKRVAKISVYNAYRSDESLREYEMLKAVRQEHVVRLHEAFVHDEFVVLVFEKLYGENVVRSLSLKNRYNEHTVTVVVKQVHFTPHSSSSSSFYDSAPLCERCTSYGNSVRLSVRLSVCLSHLHRRRQTGALHSTRHHRHRFIRSARNVGRCPT